MVFSAPDTKALTLAEGNITGGFPAPLRPKPA